MSNNRIQKSALVPYSREQMFDLVERIEDYPAFLPWCARTEVERRGAAVVIATVHIDFKGLRQAFTTTNEHVRPERIVMAYKAGPFRHLAGGWRFEHLAESACKVTFELDYAFRAGLLGTLLKPVFSGIVGSMVDAFTREAQKRYG